MRVIGVVQYTANNLDTLEGFKQGMAAQGFVEGKNVRYVFQNPAGSRDELDSQLAAVLSSKPDLLFVSPTLAAVETKKATKSLAIPVIFAPVNDPVSSGVVMNIQRPEANLTGVRLAPSEGRRLQSLLSLKPEIKKVFVPFNPKEASALESLRQLATSAQSLNISLITREIGPDTDLSPASGLVPEDADAIFMPREGLVMSHYLQFIAIAESLRIPLSTPRLDQVEEGVLTGYGFIGPEIGKQAARMASLALKGRPLANIPVETAQDYLFVNIAAAKNIGIEVPEAFLRQAHIIVRSSVSK